MVNGGEMSLVARVAAGSDGDWMMQMRYPARQSMQVPESAKLSASYDDSWIPYLKATSRHVEFRVGITVATHVALSILEVDEE